MRNTGSREPRERRETPAVSLFSIAVNTFSIRLGSRRNQRPPHQKHRSITTVSAMIDTMRMGHMTGPPLWNLSMSQLLPTVPPQGPAAGALAEAAGDGLPAAVAGLAPAAAGLSAP